MKLAAQEADRTMKENLGGPFGAAVIDREGNIISIASNTVLGDNDPTAHAEVNAIRKACTELGTYDLTNYILYTTAHPCPMCLGATIWANIKRVVYGAEPVDADEIGFRDDFVYHFIEDGMADPEILELKGQDREIGKDLFAEYRDMGKVIY